MPGEVNACYSPNYYDPWVEYTGGGYVDHLGGTCSVEPPDQIRSAPQEKPKRKITVRTNFGRTERSKASAFASGFVRGAGQTLGAISNLACGITAEKLLDEPRDAGYGGQDAGHDAGHDAGGEGGDAGHDAGGVCDNPPTAATLSTPAANATNVSVKPSFAWVKGTDQDTGDSVSSRLRVCMDATCSNVVLDRPGLTGTNYTFGGSDPTLANNLQHYWRVDSTDLCPTTTPGPETRAFTTENQCVPWTVLETNFTTGTATDLVVNAGSVSLAEDYSAWTSKYEGDVLPESATPAWTLNGSFVSIGSAGGILSYSTLGSNVTGNYTLNTASINPTGTIIEARIKTNGLDDASPPSSMGFALSVADGTRALEFPFFSDRVCEPLNSGSCNLVNTTTSYHITTATV